MLAQEQQKLLLETLEESNVPNVKANIMLTLAVQGDQL
jgi:hypothetical protein